jgi:uncharacterized membrane protein
MTFAQVILISGGMLSGLLAGLLFGFSVAVIPGLRVVPPKYHIAVMQAINEKIKNPIFLASFVGPTFLLPLSVYLYREEAGFPWLLGAAALHILAVNGVTLLGNVPLNDQLGTVKLDQVSDETAEQIRKDYHGGGALWMRWHMVRTIASALATTFVFIAAIIS